MLVIDASVAIAWAFADEDTSQSRGLRAAVQREGAQVPGIWPFEMANALLIGQRRGRIEMADATRFANALALMPIRIESASLTLATGPIRSLAQAHGLSAHDASYLGLAMREGVLLATTDERLRQAAGAVGVSLLP